MTLLNRNGQPFDAPPKIIKPIGKINPETARRTKNGKPIIRVTPEMLQRDFVKIDKNGVENAYTPLEVNQDDNTLFRLRKYQSATAAMIPREKKDAD